MFAQGIERKLGKTYLEEVPLQELLVFDLQHGLVPVHEH
jgi:hypothetical protein